MTSRSSIAGSKRMECQRPPAHTTRTSGSCRTMSWQVIDFLNDHKADVSMSHNNVTQPGSGQVAGSKEASSECLTHLLTPGGVLTGKYLGKEFPMYISSLGLSSPRGRFDDRSWGSTLYRCGKVCVWRGSHPPHVPGPTGTRTALRGP